MPRRSTNFINYIPAIILAVIVIGYAIFNFRIFIAGPQIVIQSPTNGAGLQENLVEIKGLAENINHIELNNKPIYINENDEFNEELLLQPGYNVVSLIAKDKFNRVVEQKLDLYYSGEMIAANSNETILDEADTEETEDEDIDESITL